MGYGWLAGCAGGVDSGEGMAREAVAVRWG